MTTKQAWLRAEQARQDRAGQRFRAIMDADRQWFAEHEGETVRVRPYQSGETWALKLPASTRVEVRHLGAGKLTRTFVGDDGEIDVDRVFRNAY
jgi:hypothetical protein